MLGWSHRASDHDFMCITISRYILMGLREVSITGENRRQFFGKKYSVHYLRWPS